VWKGRKKEDTLVCIYYSKTPARTRNLGVDPEEELGERGKGKDFQLWTSDGGRDLERLKRKKGVMLIQGGPVHRSLRHGKSVQREIFWKRNPGVTMGHAKGLGQA